MCRGICITGFISDLLACTLGADHLHTRGKETFELCRREEPANVALAWAASPSGNCNNGHGDGDLVRAL
jgi:hypothetical protein